MNGRSPALRMLALLTAIATPAIPFAELAREVSVPLRGADGGVFVPRGRHRASFSSQAKKRRQRRRGGR